MNREVLLAMTAASLVTALAVGGIIYLNPEAGAVVNANALPGTDLLTLAGPALEGTTDVGASTEEVVTLDQTGLVNVTFTLRWTAGSGVDTLALAVAPSAATGLDTGAVSEPESDGEITLTLAVPNTAADGTLGVGDWQVTVDFVSASSGMAVEPPVMPPGSTDSSVAWTVETSLQAHA